MLKEIYEQPQTVLNALRGRLDFEGATAKFGGLNMTAAELRGIDRIVIAASGTSWHAALVGEYLIEEFAQIPVEVEFAHEFCYRNCPLEKNTVLLVLSQSGETADTLAALREAKRRGHRALAIVNVVGSTIAREADARHLHGLHAGPRKSVWPSTKRVRLDADAGFDVAGDPSWPDAVIVRAARDAEILARAFGSHCRSRSKKFCRRTTSSKKSPRNLAKAEDFFFLGRGYSFLHRARRRAEVEGRFPTSMPRKLLRR